MIKYIIQCVKEAKCHHEWELLRETKWDGCFGGSYTQWNYICIKCNANKKINNK